MKRGAMMVFKTGQIVVSKKGRDERRFFAVMSCDENFCYLADGRLRKLEKQKKKSMKHLAATNTFLEPESLATNKALRQSISRFYDKNENCGLERVEING